MVKTIMIAIGRQSCPESHALCFIGLQTAKNLSKEIKQSIQNDKVAKVRAKAKIYGTIGTIMCNKLAKVKMMNVKTNIKLSTSAKNDKMIEID